MNAEPLTATEEATLRLEAESEQHHPGQHGEWERLTLRLLATLDVARGDVAPALVTARDAHFFEAGIAEGKRLAAEAPAPLDVERLRGAIYAVSVRHDWANSTDTEDRTEEIAREYAAEVPR